MCRDNDAPKICRDCTRFHFTELNWPSSSFSPRFCPRASGGRNWPTVYNCKFWSTKPASVGSNCPWREIKGVLVRDFISLIPFLGTIFYPTCGKIRAAEAANGNTVVRREVNKANSERKIGRCR